MPSSCDHQFLSAAKAPKGWDEVKALHHFDSLLNEFVSLLEASLLCAAARLLN